MTKEKIYKIFCVNGKYGIQSEFRIFYFNTFTQLENAYIAFCAGADLACILMCQAAIESYMRDDEGLKNRSFYDLIEQCSYDAKTKIKLHKLREYRNKWVHINEQKECNIQIDHVELEKMALFAYRLTLEVFHYYPFV